MSKNIELELKLAIDQEHVAAFRRLPFLREKALGAPRRRKLLNIYFDTPDLALKNHAMALRARRVGGKWLQTLKTAGEVTAGPQQRGEWEFPANAAEIDLTLFRETPLAKLPHPERLHLALRPVFYTDFFRTAWPVEIAQGQRVEVALDQGAILCGPDEIAISEVEIELIEGDVDSLFRIAAALAAQIPLRLESASKAERGYRLFQSVPPKPQLFAGVAIKRKWTVAEALNAIAAACLVHLQANVEGALKSEDAEYIHQMRVALRRLRSALRVFKPADSEQLAAEIKWLAGALGEARDWDVLMKESLPGLLDAHGDAALSAQLLAAGMQHQARAREIAREALRSPRFGQLLLMIARWVSTSGAQREAAKTVDDGAPEAMSPPSAESLDLVKFARREIRKRQRRLLQDAKALGELSADARHRVRIDAKRLRYSMDFFSSLFDKQQVARYLSILREIQDLLGASNDAAVASGLVERLTIPEKLGNFARGWFAAHMHIQLGDVERNLAALKEFERF